MQREIKYTIKSMLLYRGITFTKLAEKLNKSLSTISHKISRKTIKYEEVKQIGEILGFDIKFVPKSHWEVDDC